MALTPADLDPDQCLVLLKEKGDTQRWQPVSPTLMQHLLAHAAERGVPANEPLLRHRNGQPCTAPPPDARAGAAEIVNDAQANAAGLEREAQQRYDDVVGSLQGKRAALQEQIEALQQFDRDYRSRLAAFMQSQLRALGSAMPVLDAEIPPQSSLTVTGGQPTRR